MWAHLCLEASSWAWFWQKEALGGRSHRALPPGAQLQVSTWPSGTRSTQSDVTDPTPLQPHCSPEDAGSRGWRSENRLETGLSAERGEVGAVRAERHSPPRGGGPPSRREPHCPVVLTLPYPSHRGGHGQRVQGSDDRAQDPDPHRPPSERRQLAGSLHQARR